MYNYEYITANYSTDLKIMYITLRKKYFRLFKGKKINIVRHIDDTVKESMKGYSSILIFNDTQSDAFYKKEGGIPFSKLDRPQSVSIFALSKVCMWFHQGAFSSPEMHKKQMRKANLEKLKDALK